MFGLTRHQTKMVSKAAEKLSAKERELAQIKMQRAAIQKTLVDMLKMKEEKSNGDA